MSAAQEPAQWRAEPPRVLVVDDVDANLVAMEALLDDLGCTVMLAKSGNLALRALLKHEFAVMLLDVQMPEMDGYEVARYARQNPATREVPIIFLTAANNNEDNVLRGYGSGAVDFLFKPVTPSILRSKVRIFLELFVARREIANAKTVLEATNTELREVAAENAALADQFRRANEELQSAYRDLQSAQGQLVQSAKMASLGELVAGIAHEVNNPLAFVRSHLDTVCRSLGEVETELGSRLSPEARNRWDRAASRLKEMNGGLTRIADLVVKLRTFSRLDEGERKTIHVHECVESVLTILGHRLKDRIRVELRLSATDRLDCFPGPLNQALMNLISNAIDAMEREGVLTITAGADGEEYTIVVADTGSGIPAHLRERVLEPFFTTKPVGQGTGLGLSITYSIIQKHGGTLELRDAPGGGTMAIVRLPVRATGEG
jgi:two-component system NtrC family sensor kinase